MYNSNTNCAIIVGAHITEEKNKKQKTKQTKVVGGHLKCESHYFPCNHEQILKTYSAVKWKLKINVDLVHA